MRTERPLLATGIFFLETGTIQNTSKLESSRQTEVMGDELGQPLKLEIWVKVLREEKDPQDLSRMGPSQTCVEGWADDIRRSQGHRRVT